MNKAVRRIFIEKKKGFATETAALFKDLRDNLKIEGLNSVCMMTRYDISGISHSEYEQICRKIFRESYVDKLHHEKIEIADGARIFAVEYLPGQYDQRADFVAQCIQMLVQDQKPQVRVAKVIILEGDISHEEYQRIKNYYINPVETRQTSLDKPISLDIETNRPEDVMVLDSFIYMSHEELVSFMEEMGFAMDMEDLKFCQTYFKDTEKRDPTITEMRMIDTYWSDHCRHTTFLTHLKDVEFERGDFTPVLEDVFKQYNHSRRYVYGDDVKPICLMDIATIAMKELKKTGKLDDLEESDEINACSIIVRVDVDGDIQEWLVMFKNETHNHPTEIEPFGGAATCLGGAIRDPLSGRAYVYQAMRITGSGDPRTPVEDTLPGKLPQRKITTGAAAGYSSYGNQVGVATGLVTEIYDEGYVAKRMELGAVIGAVPRKDVIREKPAPGDVVILLGGRTGRDGCGGATGSSKPHTEESLEVCSAEVQKGNALEERKILRLFRHPHVTKMIKKCNDFGAGGVSVAIGELADGLDINLDAVPVKYEGLDGTEVAISESQERMAVVVSKDDVESFIKEANKENLEATLVAVVTADKRLTITWKGRAIVDISREFLNTNGVPKRAKVFVKAPVEQENPFNILHNEGWGQYKDLKKMWFWNLQRLNICSQKGLVERFDSTIGAGTVLMPFGGKYQLTPAESMVSKIPVLDGDTRTGTIMSYGYNPVIFKWSPFHGGVYAIVEAIAKVVAAGGDYRRIRLTLQEYFERLGSSPEKWGKPFSALLGAFYVEHKLGLPAIGGKDSMSGTFNDITVPPTLVAFAVAPVDVSHTISPEFKGTGNCVVLLNLSRDDDELPNFEQLDKNYTKVYELMAENKITAAHTVKGGGLSEAITKMCFGNMIGFNFKDKIHENNLFLPQYGSLILEVEADQDVESLFSGLDYNILGHTISEQVIKVNGVDIDLKKALDKWQQPLENIFPTTIREPSGCPEKYTFTGNSQQKATIIKAAKPRVFIPIFPSTNGEYELIKAFQDAGGMVDTLVFRNLSSQQISESLEHMIRYIGKSQIIVLTGGFSIADGHDDSGNFVAAALWNPGVADSIMRLIEQRDGLILGIGNGFQALLKLGLLPYGKIQDTKAECPAFTFNTVGRHVSRMVRTRVASTLSPWLSNTQVGDIHTVPVSHAEGRFVAPQKQLERLSINGQIATQYVDMDGNPTYHIDYNPFGSVEAIEGITSPDGRVFGKMGHSERIGTNTIKNIPAKKEQGIFKAGIKYFK